MLLSPDPVDRPPRALLADVDLAAKARSLQLVSDGGGQYAHRLTHRLAPEDPGHDRSTVS
jgi:hypothetical protein